MKQCNIQKIEYNHQFPTRCVCYTALWSQVACQLLPWTWHMQGSPEQQVALWFCWLHWSPALEPLASTSQCGSSLFGCKQTGLTGSSPQLEIWGKPSIFNWDRSSIRPFWSNAKEAVMVLINILQTCQSLGCRYMKPNGSVKGTLTQLFSCQDHASTCDGESEIDRKCPIQNKWLSTSTYATITSHYFLPSCNT